MTQNDLFTKEFSRVLVKEIEKRDAAIGRAVDHADRVHENWSDKAFGFLEKYVRYTAKPFTCSDIREWAESNGFEEPPSRRAWGGVIVKAKNAGLIKRVGYRNITYEDRPNSNMTPAALWAATL